MESSNVATTTYDKLLSILKGRFEDQIIGFETPYATLTVTLRPEKIIDIIQYLYQHNEAKFQYLTTLCGIHYPDQKQIAVMYQLTNLISNESIRLKIFLPEEKPAVKTLTTVFSAADWMECETFDFYGVVFEGHPNLKRILNVEEMIIFPLRKEYPLEDQTREDKNDTMFGR
jgi:NADH-quinone oxidoreductase subunit C